MAKNYGGCSHVRVLRSTDEAGDSQQVLWGCHDQEDGQLYSPRSWSLTHHLGDVALYTHTLASTLSHCGLPSPYYLAHLSPSSG